MTQGALPVAVLVLFVFSLQANNNAAVHAKDCKCDACTSIWGPQGCPDLYTVPADLVRPPMTNGTAGPGQRVRQVHPDYARTSVYHALYLPLDWNAGTCLSFDNHTRRKCPLIVEYMGNGPWSDHRDDNSSGLPKDSNLGYGLSAGSHYVWVSMPFLSSDLGSNTSVSTYWWGCPSDNAAQNCNAAYNITPTLDYTRKTIQMMVDRYGVDASNVIVTGWSRGAIACGAIARHDDTISRLWKAFVPYSHLDGDCGWVDQDFDHLQERYARIGDRPVFYVGECDVATAAGAAYLNKLNVTANYTLATTGFENHNDAWVLRPSQTRTRLRNWLQHVVDN